MIEVNNLEDNLLTSTMNNTTINQEIVENKSILEESNEESCGPSRFFETQLTENTTVSPFNTSKPFTLKELTNYKSSR